MPPSRLPCCPRQPVSANGKVNGERRTAGRPGGQTWGCFRVPRQQKAWVSDGAARGEGDTCQRTGSEPQRAGGAGVRLTALRRRRGLPNAASPRASLRQCTRGGSGGGAAPGALRGGGRRRAGLRGREDPAARAPLRLPPSPVLRLRAGRGAEPHAPGCPAAPRGGGGAAPTCSGAAGPRSPGGAVTCGGGSGGGGGSRGEEGASFRKGWDLPARCAAARPRLILGSRLPGLPGRVTPLHTHPQPRVSGFHHPSGPRIVTRGWSRAGTVKPLLSKAFVNAIAWRSLLTQQKEGLNLGSSAWWLFIPDLL